MVKHWRPLLATILLSALVATWWPLQWPQSTVIATTSGREAVAGCEAGLPPISGAPLPAQFTLTLWNGQKLSSPYQQQELVALARHTQLLLLQEANSLATPPLPFWQLAEAWGYGDQKYGVMGLALQPMPSPCLLLTPEPWLRLPKTTLAWRWPMAGGKPVLVINSHATNFDWRLASYTAWLDQLGTLIDRHDGPVVLAGDLNSWNGQRTAALDRWGEAHGLTAVTFNPDRRVRKFGYPVDAVWTRGLKVIASASAGDSSSDHHPLWVTLARPRP